MAQYQSSLTGPEIDAALTDMAQHDSEAWAVGQRDGDDVTSLDVTYHNNAKYYSDNAMGAAARAEAAVPAGTAGAVFFNQSQTLTDSQKAQACENIGAQIVDNNVMVIGDLGIASNRYNNTNVTSAGWYRLFKLKQATVNSNQYLHIAGQIFITGFYNAYKPSKGVFSFDYDGGSGGHIVELSGVGSTSPTQIRITSTSSSSPDGEGYVMVDLYYSNTGTMTGNNISVIACGVKGITATAPTAVASSPTGETVRASLTIATVSTGKVSTTA